MGCFGPPGVSAIFYLMLGMESVQRQIIDVEGERVGDDARDLFHMLQVSVWFVVMSCVVSPFACDRWVPP